MKVSIAQTAGFCMGVRRAVEMVLDSPGTYDEPIYTFGPLIHNPQVLSVLAEKGITELKKIPKPGRPGTRSGTVLIRAHGVPPHVRRDLAAAGYRVVDATCPRVIRVQTIIKQHAKKGYAVIIVGDQDHPEVVGLSGYAGDNGYVVGDMAAFERLPRFDRAIIVAQTTQSRAFFYKIRTLAESRYPHYKIFNTICDSTTKRQKEIQRLSRNVDAVIVVGGKKSGNTRRLAEVAAMSGKPVRQIETEDELDANFLDNVNHVGITAGASTPNWVINRVLRSIEGFSHGTRKRRWRKLIFDTQRFLLLTNLFVAVGAGGLTAACMAMQRFEFDFSFAWIAGPYVLSMHLINNLIGHKADGYNDPGRVRFYRRYRSILVPMAVVAGVTGLVVAYAMGPGPFLALLTMTLLGLSYAVYWIPGRLTGNRFRRLKDIPGSKTILISLAWGMVAALFPALVIKGHIGIDNLWVFFWAAGLVFSRTAFFDLLDIQGDRMVGRETIPLLLGEKKTRRWLRALLSGLIIWLWAGAALGLVTSLGVALAVCPLFLLMMLQIYKNRWILPGIRLELFIESVFIWAGLATVIWIGCNGIGKYISS